METSILISVISLSISLIVVIIAALSLYFNSLKTVDLDTKIELRAKDIEESEKEIPDDLHFDIHMCIFNNGNSPGIVRNIRVRFMPRSGFKKFISKFQSFGFPEYVEVPAKGTSYKSGIGRVLLKNVSRDIRDLLSEDIENETLLSLLEDMERKKTQDIEEFLNFLKRNKTLGDLEIIWEHTYSPRKIFSIEFKSKTEIKPVIHSYENLLEVCDYWVYNFEFKSTKDKEINGFIGNLKSLKGLYTRSLSEYRSNKGWLINANFELHNGRFQNTFTLLRKCKKYRSAVEIIEKPYKRISDFLGYMERYKGSYPKDKEQKVEEVGAMLKDFEKETQEAIENIDSLIKSIKAENNEGE